MALGKRNTLTIVLFIIYILLLIGTILFKLPFHSDKADRIREINLIPFLGLFDNTVIQRDTMYNMLFFIPLGIYISMLKNKWSFINKILPIICLTLAFEVVQFIFAIGRTDITDILCNTFGGIIGIGVYALLFRIFKNRTIMVVNILASVLTFFILLFYAFLFFSGLNRHSPPIA